MTKGIIYYTDNQLDEPLASTVRTQLMQTGLPIVSVSLQPLAFGINVVLDLVRGYETMFKQIHTALVAQTTEIVFFCEHDVLYPMSHFTFTPSDPHTFYYNVNVWKVRHSDGYAYRVDDCRQVSGIAVNRACAIRHYAERLDYVRTHGYTPTMGFEPGTHGRIDWVYPIRSATFSSMDPLVDVRHDKNLSRTRWHASEFRNARYTTGWTDSICPAWALPVLYPEGLPCTSIS